MVVLIRALVLVFAATACATTPPAANRDGLHLSVDELPAGSRVSVAGSFNGWDPSSIRLREREPGSFEGVVDLGPGVHRLQLVVRLPDGTERWLAPPGLARYEPDGFGGSNAVVEIP